MFGENDYSDSDYSDMDTRHDTRTRQQYASNPPQRTAPRRQPRLRGNGRATSTHQSEEVRRMGGTMGNRVENSYSISRDTTSLRADVPHRPTRSRGNPLSKPFVVSSNDLDIDGMDVADVRRMIPPSMPGVSDATIEEALAYFREVEAMYRRFTDTTVYDFVCTVSSRAMASMSRLIEDFDLISSHPSMNTLLGESVSAALAQSIATGGGSSGASTSGFSNVPSDIMALLQARGALSGLPTKTQPPAKTTGAPPDDSATLGLAVAAAGATIGDSIVAAFGSVQSVTLNELKQNGLILPIISEYEKRKASHSINRLLRRGAAHEKIRFTAQFKGLLNSSMRRVTQRWRQLYSTKFEQFMEDSEVRTDLAEFVGLMMIERATLPNPRGDAYVVTEPRVVQNINDVLQSFERARVDGGGNVTYGEGGGGVNILASVMPPQRMSEIAPLASPFGASAAIGWSASPYSIGVGGPVSFASSMFSARGFPPFL